MEIGMGKPFIQLPFNKFGTWTTETWLKTMWNHLGDLEIELLWRDIPSLPLKRNRGKYIVAEVSGLYDMDKRTMRRLNRIRLSMEVYAMSDIETGDGLSIRQDMVAEHTIEAKKQNQYK